MHDSRPQKASHFTETSQEEDQNPTQSKYLVMIPGAWKQQGFVCQCCSVKSGESQTFAETLENIVCEIKPCGQVIVWPDRHSEVQLKYLSRNTRWPNVEKSLVANGLLFSPISTTSSLPSCCCLIVFTHKYLKVNNHI